MDDKAVSKVLVLDNSAEHAPRIKLFCEENSLIALKVRKDLVVSVLQTNIDLGGILYSEHYGDTPEETINIALQIHNLRPELPIFIRRADSATLEGLPSAAHHAFAAAYVIDDMKALHRIIHEYIFCLTYPNELLRGISEIADSVLRSQFKALSVSKEAPYIVHDRVIFGELLSLIQLESSWCRGYMMLQTEEDLLLDLMGRNGTGASSASFHTVNDLLCETTNLIWGSFKNRYIGDGATSAIGKSQVPLVINHKHKYISFGTENPQLCFRFTLKDEVSGRSSMLIARFIFNLNWAPEDFKEITRDTADLIDSGELEMF